MKTNFVALLALILTLSIANADMTYPMFLSSSQSSMLMTCNQAITNPCPSASNSAACMTDMTNYMTCYNMCSSKMNFADYMSCTMACTYNNNSSLMTYVTAMNTCISQLGMKNMFYPSFLSSSQSSMYMNCNMANSSPCPSASNSAACMTDMMNYMSCYNMCSSKMNFADFMMCTMACTYNNNSSLTAYVTAANTCTNNLAMNSMFWPSFFTSQQGQMLMMCQQKITNPCPSASNSAMCMTSMMTYNTCYNKCSSKMNINDYMSCTMACTSNDSSISMYIQSSNMCISMFTMPQYPMFLTSSMSTMLSQCNSKIQNPCQTASNQAMCMQDMMSYLACYNMCSSKTTISDYMTCTMQCTSTDQALSMYITSMNMCSMNTFMTAMQGMMNPPSFLGSQDNMMLKSCMQSITNPCTNSMNMSQCSADIMSYMQCSMACGSKTSISDYKTCSMACTSTDQMLQDYINSTNACLNKISSSILLKVSGLILVAFSLII
ncbi:hypothetical protein ABPG74_018596 [Tetrahymena malaccensis]